MIFGTAVSSLASSRALASFALILVVLATSGCSETIVEPDDVPDEDVVVADSRNWAEDPFEANSAAVKGHRLTIEVSYGGGCRTHDFTLVISESFQESDPVQLSAMLAHDADGDPCQAWLTESLVFDLRLIRERYIQAYGPGPGTVVLNIKGVSEDSLVYEFDG